MYNPQQDSQMDEQPQDWILNVKFALDGAHIASVHVLPNDERTVFQLKRELEEPSQTPAICQQLLYEGRRLNDEEMLVAALIDQNEAAYCSSINGSLDLLRQPPQCQGPPRCPGGALRCPGRPRCPGGVFCADDFQDVVSRGFADFCTLLLNGEWLKDAQVNALDNSGRSALHRAAERGHVGVCKALLEHKRFTMALFQISEGPMRGWTALHSAASKGHQDVCQLLLEHSSFSSEKVNAVDESRRTALHLAAEKGHSDVCHLFLQVALAKSTRFTALNVTDVNGRTVLHWAAESGLFDVVQSILQHPQIANVNAVDVKSCTALHRAAELGHCGVCQVLLEDSRFTAVNEPDRNSCTALHRAAGKCHFDVCAVLLQSDRFTTASATDRHGRSAFHLWVANGKYDMFNNLLAQFPDKLGGCLIRTRIGTCP